MMNHVKQSNVQAVLAVCVGLVLAMGGLAQADLVAYDGFDYSPASYPADLSAQTGGGQGDWSGNWSDNAPTWGMEIYQGGLSYTDANSDELPVVGDRVVDNNGGDHKSWRQFTTTGLADPGDVLWFSMLVKNDGTGSDMRVKFFAHGNSSNTGAGIILYGSDGSVKIAAEKSWNNSEYTSSEAYTPTASGDVTFLVGKITIEDDQGSTDDHIYLWANPLLDTEPVDTNADAHMQEGGSGFELTGSYVVIDGGGSFLGAADEIRLGTTFSDVVVPEPATLGLLGLGGLAMLRRRRA